MKKILTACLSLLVTIMAQAQGSWIPPQFPGAEMPAGADGTTIYGLCNIETGTFALAGMNWNTHAISQRLLNGENSLPEEQHVTVSKSNGKLKFSINGKNYLGGGTGVNDLWVDQAANNEWTPTQVESGVYNLSNAGGDLDVLWKNGGPLTPNGGVGKTKWGLVEKSNIENGKYSLYKAKVQLYGLYKACYDAGCVEVYPEAFASALAAYNADNATAASIQAAYVTLFKAVYMAVDENTAIDASPLFTNADMAASGNCSGWDIDRGISWSVFESYWDANFNMTQTQTLPSGKYSATLHAFARLHNSFSNPTFTIQTSEANKFTMDVKYIGDVDFGTVSGNGGGFVSNKPNGMQSGGVAICHGDLEYATEFISVSEGQSVTITMYKPGSEQWLLWQDIKLTYKGMTEEELVAMMADKIAVAQALAQKHMDADKLEALNEAINQASGGTRAQILKSGPVLDAAIDAARASIAACEEARQLIVTALERFEEDYNDGENGALRHMSTAAWTTLLEATKTASYIKDFGKNIGSDTWLSATEMGNAATAFNEAMANAEPSIALYNKYELLFSGLNRWVPTQFPATTYATDAVKATDTSVQQAITDMDAAFTTYKETLEGDQDVTMMAGENLDFESAQGEKLNGNAYTQPGWTMTYVYNGTDGNKQFETFTTEKDDLPDGANGQALHMRNRWAGSAGVAQITKTFVLPSGNYDLSLWMKYLKATTGSLCYYEVDGVRTNLTTSNYGEWHQVSNVLEVKQPSIITISLGVSGGNDMNVYVDDITITLMAKTAYEKAHEIAVNAQSEHNSSVAISSALAEYSATTQEEAEAAGYDIGTAIAVLNNAVTMAAANDEATGLLANADFSGGTLDNGQYPEGWTFTRNLGGWIDCNVNNGVFNMWAGTINSSELSQVMNNLPDGIYAISGDFKNDKLDGTSKIGIFADQTGTVTGRSIDVGCYSENDGDFYTYTAYVETKGHNMRVGVYSGNGYYQLKNVKVKMLENTQENQSLVANSALYQEVAFNRDANEYNFTDSKYAKVSGIDFKGMTTQKNALFTVAQASQLAATNNVIIDNVCENLVLTDKAPFKTTSTFTATAATYIRTMPTRTEGEDEVVCQWGTVMLPYEVSSDDDVKFYTLSEVNAESEEEGYMSFTEADKLPANTPGIFVKQGAEATEVTFSGSNVTVAPEGTSIPDTGVEGWTLKGTYSQLNLTAAETAANNLYFISGDQFWHATGTLAVAPFRAYFEDASSSAVRAFRLVANDVANGIQIVPVSENGQEVYTLSGVRLPGSSKLKAGIYIINNKKTVVK